MLIGIITNLLHRSMVIVGLPRTARGQVRFNEVAGDTSDGAGPTADGGGARQVSANGLGLARSPDRHGAEIVAKPAARVVA